MNIQNSLVASLGFHTSKYVGIERERRWLCRVLPKEITSRTERITDLYVTGARLRLREATPLSGGPTIFRLTRKADVDAYTRLITTIYLAEEEFRLLFGLLPGKQIHKLRHRLPQASGIVTAIDEFEGDLSGLILAEAEFDSAEQLSIFPAPHFSVREITDDPRFTGAYLANHGLPHNLSELLAMSAN